MARPIDEKRIKTNNELTKLIYLRGRQVKDEKTIPESSHWRCTGQAGRKSADRVVIEYDLWHEGASRRGDRSANDCTRCLKQDGRSSSGETQSTKCQKQRAWKLESASNLTNPELGETVWNVRWHAKSSASQLVVSASDWTARVFASPHHSIIIIIISRRRSRSSQCSYHPQQNPHKAFSLSWVSSSGITFSANLELIRKCFDAVNNELLRSNWDVIHGTA